MHLPPEIWGPIFWSTMHIVTMAYPDSPSYAEKRAAKEFFQSMTYLLPCPVCREHFTEVLQGLPVTSWLDNRTSLVDWLWQVHNRVNQRLGKREITQAEFFARYKEMADRGLPVPPAADIQDTGAQEAYARGATHAVAAISVAAAIGGLLWASYR